MEYHLQGLAPADQALLEAASVAGATFTAAEVMAGLEQREDAVEARCQLLARHGQFMREASFETWPDGTLTSAYQFIHAIYHDAVYARSQPVVKGGYIAVWPRDWKPLMPVTSVKPPHNSPFIIAVAKII